MSTPVGVPARPGKIIAVHVAYESRAAQRGKRPAQPSYFLKAASSVAASGQTIERPAGTSLLAFEGEVAIVIGTSARNVTEADAWSYVAGVTASNDFGLYDMKTPDKGSNVRSKSRDGYTPLGPSSSPPPRRLPTPCACAPGSTAKSSRTTAHAPISSSSLSRALSRTSAST